MTSSRFYQFAAVLTLTWSLLASTGCAQDHSLSIDPADYPAAHRSEHTDTFHGTSIEDPYRWMEDLDSEELRHWLDAQDSLLSAYVPTDASVEELASDIIEARQTATLVPPVIRGPWRFIRYSEAGQTVQNLYVMPEDSATETYDSDDGRGRLLLDMNSARLEDVYVSVASLSPEGSYVATFESDGPSRWKRLRLMRTRDGSYVSDELTGVITGSVFAWMPDESGFFYTRYEIPDDPQAALGAPRIFYHGVGTNQSEDPIVWRQQDGDDLTFNLTVPPAGTHLVIEGSASGGTFSGMFNRIFVLDLADWTPADRPPAGAAPGNGAGVYELFAGSEADYSYEAMFDDRFVIRTNEGAQNMRLITVSPDGNGRPENLVPEEKWPMHAVTAYQDRLLVRYIRDTKNVLRVVSSDGTVLEEIDDKANNIFGQVNHPDQSVAFYGVTRLVEPGTVYRLDLSSLERTLYYRPELPFDPDDFVSEVVYTESADGTRIPISLVYRRDTRLDGSAPLIMYGYGAWAWSAFPWQRYFIPWLEAGGIYAVAHVRGGGEFGSDWHEAGIRQNRESWIEDYLSSAEYLIEQQYTSADRFVANGGSASGMLPAIGMNRRPDLFGAALIDYPFLDMIRMKQFGSGASYVPEYGDPDIEEDFRVLAGYSPYHRIEEGTCYPPVMVQAGSEDQTSTPMHAYKYVAALQHAQSCDNPILLKIAWGAGHSAGRTAEQRAHTQAIEQIFLARTVGLDLF